MKKRQDSFGNLWILIILVLFGCATQKHAFLFYPAVTTFHIILNSLQSDISPGKLQLRTVTVTMFQIILNSLQSDISSYNYILSLNLCNLYNINVYLINDSQDSNRGKVLSENISMTIILFLFRQKFDQVNKLIHWESLHKCLCYIEQFKSMKYVFKMLIYIPSLFIICWRSAFAVTLSICWILQNKTTSAQSTWKWIIIMLERSNNIIYR